MLRLQLLINPLDMSAADMMLKLDPTEEEDDDAGDVSSETPDLIDE